MYQLIFYVPESHLEPVKAASFAAGGGRIGEYDHCCWQTLGQGQFRASENADPFIGESGQVERVPEYKVEMVCASDVVKAVVDAMLSAHPYEEPAWSVFPMVVELPDG